uniref:Cytochrome P450 monooxygenase CYP52X1 n=1 Tax=Ganoderma boninense TaxID=34458 RepID=A0A5K1K6I1_9APHY|nr:Cytochrome P450 monooxygenase CYP52X1 [Ganoderma boninense]
MDVDLAYTISGGQLVFPPPSSSASGGSFAPGNSNINLSVSPNVTANAKLVAHLKPTFEFGLTTAGASVADIFLDLDTFAELDLTLTGAANGALSAGAAGSNSTSPDAGAGGCVDISTGLSVDAGGELFKLSKTITLFNKSFDLFKKCFGNGYQKRDFHHAGNGRLGHSLSHFEHNWRKREHHGPSSSSQASAIGRRRLVRKSDKGFSCPTSALGVLSSIVSETVDGSR